MVARNGSVVQIFLSSGIYLVLVLKLGLVKGVEQVLVIVLQDDIALIEAEPSLQSVVAKVFLPVSREFVNVLPQGQRFVGLDDDRGDAVDGEIILVHAQVKVVHQVQFGHLVILIHCRGGGGTKEPLFSLENPHLGARKLLLNLPWTAFSPMGHRKKPNSSWAKVLFIFSQRYELIRARTSEQKDGNEETERAFPRSWKAEDIESEGGSEYLCTFYGNPLLGTSCGWEFCTPVALIFNPLALAQIGGEVGTIGLEYLATHTTSDFVIGSIAGDSFSISFLVARNTSHNHDT